MSCFLSFHFRLLLLWRLWLSSTMTPRHELIVRKSCLDVQVALSTIDGGTSFAGEGWTLVSYHKIKTNDEIIQESSGVRHSNIDILHQYLNLWLPRDQIYDRPSLSPYRHDIRLPGWAPQVARGIGGGRPWGHISCMQVGLTKKLSKKSTKIIESTNKC
jgi:hypothetical protein